MQWGNRAFLGTIPRADRRQLPVEAAEAAVDCWLKRRRPSPLPVLVPVAGVDAGRANTRSIYRMSNDHWFGWLEDVDVALAPVVGDADTRIIWSGQGAGAARYLRQTSLSILQGQALTDLHEPPVSRRLGVPPPAAAAQVALGAEPAGAAATDPEQSDAWVFTFVTDLQEEGPPSPPSAVLKRKFTAAGVLQAVTVTMPTAAPADFATSGITHKRVYRTATGASGVTTYQFVAQVELATADYVDTLATARLGSGLISTQWDPPRADLEGLIALPNGVMCAFRGREVHFSEPYQPHAWPGDYVQVTEAPIVGLDNFGTSVVVGTMGDPYLISGTHPAEVAADKVEYPQACVSKQSFAYVELQGVCYASPDGLVLIGPNGAQLVSKPLFDRQGWQALNPAGMRAIYHDGNYMAFLDGSGLAFDTEATGVITTPDNITTVWHDRANDQVFVIDEADNRLKEWRATGNGAKRSMRWRSRPHIGMGRTFTCAQVIADGYPVTFRLYAGERLVFTKVAQNGKAFRLPELAEHSDWQYEVEARETVTEVRIGQSMRRDMLLV